MIDAEGWYNDDPCPNCSSTRTITYEFVEGFNELECELCGYRSDAEELSDLGRYRGDLKEHRENKFPPIPIKKLKA